MFKKLISCISSLLILSCSVVCFAGDNFNILDVGGTVGSSITGATITSSAISSSTGAFTTLTSSGLTGLGGATNSNTVLNVAATNPLSGTDQTGIISSIVGSSAATASITGMQVRGITAAASYTSTLVNSLRVIAPAAGAGSTITRALGIRVSMPTVGGTGNAAIADVVTFSGSWFIYQTVRGDSLFTGHHAFTGTAPGIGTGASDCGTTPVISGNDTTGIVTVGSGTNGGVCTLTFANSWTSRPVCMVQNETTANLARGTDATTLLFKITGTFVAGDTLSYHCFSPT